MSEFNIEEVPEEDRGIEFLQNEDGESYSINYIKKEFSNLKDENIKTDLLNKGFNEVSMSDNDRQLSESFNGLVDKLVKLRTERIKKEKVKNFRKELENLINKFSMENGSNTPDFMLADYLIDALNNFEKITKKREKWYGRNPKKVKGQVGLKDNNL
jgi:hypothetical protein